MKVPNHKIPNYSLLERFYNALDSNANGVEDTITRGAFMKNTFEEATETLDIVMKTNRAWHTRELEASAGTYVLASTVDIRIMNKELSKEIAQMRIKVSIFATQLAGTGVEKVIVVGS